jgi:hypothetical protein
MGSGRELDVCGDSTLRALVSQVSARAARLHTSIIQRGRRKLCRFSSPDAPRPAIECRTFLRKTYLRILMSQWLCVICKQVHVVNPATSAVLGEGSEQVTSRPGHHS